MSSPVLPGTRCEFYDVCITFISIIIAVATRNVLCCICACCNPVATTGPYFFLGVAAGAFHKGGMLVSVLTSHRQLRFHDAFVNQYYSKIYFRFRIRAPAGARAGGCLTAEISFVWRWIALEPCRESESYEECFCFPPFPSA